MTPATAQVPLIIWRPL